HRGFLVRTGLGSVRPLREATPSGDSPGIYQTVLLSHEIRKRPSVFLRDLRFISLCDFFFRQAGRGPGTSVTPNQLTKNGVQLTRRHNSVILCAEVPRYGQSPTLSRLGA